MVWASLRQKRNPFCCIEKAWDVISRYGIHVGWLAEEDRDRKRSGRRTDWLGWLWLLYQKQRQNIKRISIPYKQIKPVFFLLIFVFFIPEKRQSEVQQKKTLFLKKRKKNHKKLVAKRRKINRFLSLMMMIPKRAEECVFYIQFYGILG